MGSGFVPSARNTRETSFVLSGYTAAIVGIPSALSANSAFYVGTARVTEICLETMLIGYLSALLFASVGQFQNRMTYDPVDLLNTSIAAVFAASFTLVLWAVVAPETAEAARQRFLRVARQAIDRLTAQRHPIGFAEFETRIAESLDQLQSHQRADQPRDLADLAAGSRLLGAGHALLRRWQQDGAEPPVAAARARGSDRYVAGLAGTRAHPSFC